MTREAPGVLDAYSTVASSRHSFRLASTATVPENRTKVDLCPFLLPVYGTNSSLPSSNLTNYSVGHTIQAFTMYVLEGGTYCHESYELIDRQSPTIGV
jgi:hypothetical protein